MSTIVTEKEIQQLQLTANTIRQTIIRMLMDAGAGHTAGPLGMADIFTALYFHELKHDPKNPSWSERDRVILSNGHICPVRYAAMYHAGYQIQKEELSTFRKIDSRLEGHPAFHRLPGVETSSGPLGEGLSEACGFAFAAKMDHKPHHIWCLASDGEHAEGMTWEAVMLAAKYKLDNLCVIIDRNYIQIDGFTEDVMPLDLGVSLADKYKAFGWNVLEIGGHDFADILGAFEKAKSAKGKPTCIVARTTPGKGVDFMENNYKWHGVPPNKTQAEEALAQLARIEDALRRE
ncbi:MAG: transketolase [Candidatus Pacebacteria bacterium]|jgi:transketolase|nr:transketolase [Candidatus Paceibacterota bacterium]